MGGRQSLCRVIARASLLVVMARAPAPALLQLKSYIIKQAMEVQFRGMALAVQEDVGLNWLSLSAGPFDFLLSQCLALRVGSMDSGIIWPQECIFGGNAGGGG